MFVCHGNICRSPMAEFVLKKKLVKEGLQSIVEVASSATSMEEIGNSVHRGTVRRLAREGITVEGKRAVRLTEADGREYDLLVAMDGENLRNMRRILKDEAMQKVKLLLDFTPRKGEDVADPWYTGDFDATYRDVDEGCDGIIRYIKKSIEGERK